jgi:hypothetical protein
MIFFKRMLSLMVAVGLLSGCIFRLKPPYRVQVTTLEDGTAAYVYSRKTRGEPIVRADIGNYCQGGYTIHQISSKRERNASIYGDYAATTDDTYYSALFSCADPGHVHPTKYPIDWTSTLWLNAAGVGLLAFGICLETPGCFY